MIIECHRVKFYAPYDKDAFFEYIAKIKSIIEVKGKKDSIYLTIDKNVHDDDLYNMIGLLRRYAIEMNQLRVLLDKSQKELFDRCSHGYSVSVYPASNTK